MYQHMTRERLRRWSVPTFARRMAELHPELRRPVGWPEFMAIAEREGIVVRVIPLSRPARLIRYGRTVAIQLSDAISRQERAERGMHELCHFWRDDPGESCYYSDDETITRPIEDFADIFAWVVTTTAPCPVKGLREDSPP